MRRRIFVIILAVLTVLTAVFCGSCSSKSGGMKDGYYTAEGADFDSHGWKEYVTIYVSNNSILTIEYDAYNASGFVRSWDINYMRSMSLRAPTYPNEFTRIYGTSLIDWQDPDKVDAVTGATTSHVTFVLLAKAAIEYAKAGNEHVAHVVLETPGASAEG